MTDVVNDTALDETLAEARSLASQPRLWAGLFGIGIVVGLIGPFGTYDTMPTLARTGYWLAVVATTFWIGYLTSFATASWLEGRGIAPRWSSGLAAAAASVPVTIWLAGLHALIFAAPFWADAVRLFPYVAVISLVASALSEALETGGSGPVARDAERQDSAWLDQLPARLGRDLMLLQAQDHYVCARTSLGETLIRTTIREATRALGSHGLRVHRSWWVSHTAIRAYAYKNGAPVLILRDGTEVPVGRTYRRAVREALR